MVVRLPRDVANEVAEVLRDSIAVCGPGLFGELLLAAPSRLPHGPTQAEAG